MPIFSGKAIRNTTMACFKEKGGGNKASQWCLSSLCLGQHKALLKVVWQKMNNVSFFGRWSCRVFTRSRKSSSPHSQRGLCLQRSVVLPFERKC